jgi:hypothetical protein
MKVAVYEWSVAACAYGNLALSKRQYEGAWWTMLVANGIDSPNAEVLYNFWSKPGIRRAIMSAVW